MTHRQVRTPQVTTGACRERRIESREGNFVSVKPSVSDQGVLWFVGREPL